MDKIGRIQELVRKLNIYRDEYYNLNHPSVLDSTYDSLFDELSLLEKETGFVLSNSPTQSVGYEVKSKLQKRVHPTPLKSLDKTKSIDELNKFRNDKEVILMLKADGLTVELDFEDGQFIGGYTRGNGEIGEDITHNVKTFKNIPLTIPFKGKLRIVGEAVIHWNDFNEINSKLPEEEKYATPRNLVAGSVRQLDSKICAERNVYFYAFNILECGEKLSDSKHCNFAWLWEQGFWTIFCLRLIGDVTQFDIEGLTDYAKNTNIPIDGMVLSFDSINYSQSLGSTSHHPLHSMAFKFEDETEETILRDIEWNTTRSAQINPTAIFDTVILDNTEVSRASLFNLTFIKDMQLNLLNRITVSKRNLIIPYIEENLDRQEGNYVPIPDKCPSCGAKTEIKNTGTADFLYCTNTNCPAQLLDKFVNFVKRDGMNIEGLSEATLEKFINKGWLKTFDDIYRLDEHKAEITTMEGFGIKSYNNLIKSIEKSKNVSMANFLVALGIPQIGKGGAKRLAKHFNNDMLDFFNCLDTNYDFTQIEDFGETTASALIDYFYGDNDNLEMVYRLLEHVTILQEKKKEIANIESTFSGKKLYCTGTFASYKKNELQKIIEDLGGEFGSGYAKSLDYLVVGSLKGSSKEDKARKDGVSILTEDQFLEMIK